MRIGIITLPLHTNYGGIIQAYALQTILNSLGHNASVIYSPYRDHPLWKQPFAVGIRVLRKILKDWNTRIFVEHEQRIIRRSTEAFILHHIQSRRIRTTAEIGSSDYDAFVVGSDQIWRYRYIIEHQMGLMPYLDFARDWQVGRCAYAASFGIDEWDYPEEYSEECRRLITLFDAISVREDIGIDFCRDYLGVKAVHLLDPTMLLDANHYVRLIEEAAVPHSPGDLFCYILDQSPEKQDLINRIVDRYGLHPFSVMPKRSICDQAPVCDRIVQPIEQWLRGFADAKMVVTDSFHGCAFSIIFGRPFVAIGNAARGLSRMQSLLRMFDMTDHLISDLTSATPIPAPDLPVNLSEQLEARREEALTWLRQALKSTSTSSN